MSELTPERERIPPVKSEEQKEEASAVPAELRQAPQRARRPTVRYLIMVHENMIRLAAQEQGLPGPGTARPSVIPAQPRGTGTVVARKPALGGMESVLTGPSLKEARPSQVPPVPAKNLKAPDRFADQLKTLFPNFAITPDKNLAEEDWKFWEQNRVSEFLTSLVRAGLLDAEDKDASIKLFREGGGIRINVAGKKPLLPPEERVGEKPDERPFSLVQDFLPGKEGLNIYVESVVAPRRGRPFVKSGLLAFAEQTGVGKIRLKASGIGGSQEGVFAWARYGFLPTAEAWKDMRRSGLAKLRDQGGKLPTGVRSELEDLLLNPSPQALRWMIYLSWKQKNDDVTKFLNAVLSSSVGWDGELDLTDPDSVSWASTYASVAKAENELATFARLLPALPKERVNPEPEKKETKEEMTEEPEDEPVTDQDIEFLASTIKEGNATLEELYDQYGGKPDVIEKVLNRLRSE